MITKCFLTGAVFIALWSPAGGEEGGYLTTAWSCYGPTTYSTESVPYYALHPPVYYSYRVARTYGASPFALPPASSASVLANVSSAFAAEQVGMAGEEPTARPPLRIANPFAEQPDAGASTGSSPAVNFGGRHPQIVYPSAVAQRVK